MNTCELRLKAAEILETKGWTQGILLNEKGECCILGALLLAKDITPYKNTDTQSYYNKFKEDSELNQCLKDMGFGKSEMPIMHEAFRFNDNWRNTKEDVINKLKEGCK